MLATTPSGRLNAATPYRSFAGVLRGWWSFVNKRTSTNALVTTSNGISSSVSHRPLRRAAVVVQTPKAARLCSVTNFRTPRVLGVLPRVSRRRGESAQPAGVGRSRKVAESRAADSQSKALPKTRSLACSASARPRACASLVQGKPLLCKQASKQASRVEAAASGRRLRNFPVHSYLRLSPLKGCN